MGTRKKLYRDIFRVFAFAAFMLSLLASVNAAFALPRLESAKQDVSPTPTQTSLPISVFIVESPTPTLTAPPASMFVPASSTPVPPPVINTPFIGMFVPPTMTQSIPKPAPSPVSSSDLFIAVGAVIFVGIGAVVFVMTQAMRPTLRAPLKAESHAVLIGLNGSFVGQRITVRNGMMIGRSQSCAVILSDPSVSRTHARIIFEQGQWYIQDMNSQSGVYVNGARVRRGILSRGSRIRIGITEFQFS